MPVPTQTFRDMKKLNVLFAISAVALLGSTVWLIIADHEKPWRQIQRDGRVWDVAMTEDAHQLTLTAETLAELERLQRELLALEDAINQDEVVNDLRARLSELEVESRRLALSLNIARGMIAPAEQQLEHARLTHGEASRAFERAQTHLARVREDFRQINQTVSQINQNIDDVIDELDTEEERLRELRAEHINYRRRIDQLEATLDELGPSLIAKVRDAPLMNWMNPWEKPRQVVAPGVYTNLHFLQGETIDRCMTCHINIDRPEFEVTTLTSFLERQIAINEGQDVLRLDSHGIERPAVLLDFWANTARAAGHGAQVDELEAQAVQQINALYELQRQQQLADVTGEARQRLEQQELRTVQQADLYKHLESLVAIRDGESGVLTLGEWYAPAAELYEALRGLLETSLSESELAKLRDTYRQTTTTVLNEYRREQGRERLSDNRVLLAHPRLDLYIADDSPHPMDTPGNAVRTMACTVCHEGAGQETDFIHSAHMPRDIWVDAQTGATLPNFLVKPHGDSEMQPQDRTEPGDVDTQVALAGNGATNGSTGQGNNTGNGAQEQVDSENPAPRRLASREELVQFVHDDLYLVDREDREHPYAPQRAGDTRAEYIHPTGGQRLAVTQETYWKQQYQWKFVDFNHWERPMHTMDYIQSSCSKCHTEIFDIRDEASLLYEGRRLFAQLGCVNCHGVHELEPALDVKKVGPSLVHVGEKLSADMIGSWIWSPRGFRPTAQMPHYFMLENNSSPVDIRRTRTEVAAMTYFLLNTSPSESYYAAQGRDVPRYSPQELSESMLEPSEASIDRGREIFNTIGCLACHSNLEDQTRPWLVADLRQRLNLESDEQANQRLDEMTYNERQWYAQRYIPERISDVGPELSGVGTKLMAGRPEEQAYAGAKRWLFDWLRNPQHYSEYSIMPALRLSEAQASDLADYLLSLQRPGSRRLSDGTVTNADDDGGKLPYQPSRFSIEDVDVAMLEELVVALEAAQSTPELVRRRMRENPEQWSVEAQLEFLGQRMISHYGCASCHTINGMEDAAPVGAELSGWGSRDPHMLDFGYFSRAFNRERSVPFPGWRVDGEGLTDDAAHIDGEDAYEVQWRWEDLGSLRERRPWLYQKLHNPRIWDRGITSLNAAEDDDGFELGRPYDKLKMPKFFLSDDQVRAVVTYVTSLTPSGVTPEFQRAATDEQQMRIARGRQVATLFNCYGCHNIEGNDVPIQDFYATINPLTGELEETINWAPPRLLGQGAKTQPDWLYHFLQNVNGHPNIPADGSSPVEGESPIRPWLAVRMPSYPMTPDHARHLVDYFAAHSQKLSAELHGSYRTIESYIREYADQVEAVRQEIARFEQEMQTLRGREENERTQRRIAQLEALRQARIDRLEGPQGLIARDEQRQATWFESTNEQVRIAIDDLLAFAIRSRIITSEADLEPDPMQFSDTEELTREQQIAIARQNNWNMQLMYMQVLVKAWETDYPYAPKYRPRITDEEFLRGERLVMQMGCATGECHRIGDEDILRQAGVLGGDPDADELGDDPWADDQWGDDPWGDDPAEATSGAVVSNIGIPSGRMLAGAPNLGAVHQRLQRHWVEQWLRHADRMQPRTSMQTFWKPVLPDAQRGEVMTPGSVLASHSHFRTDIPYPPDARDDYESMFGRDPATQMRLVHNFLYDVGRRAISYDLEGQRISGPAADIELGQIADPSEQTDERQAAREDEPSTPQTPEPTTPEPEAEAEPVAREVKVSQIADFHEEASKPWEGTRVIGRVTFEGRVPPRRPIQMRADAYCVRAHRGHDAPMTEDLIINEDGTMRNVVVFVKSGLEGHDIPQLQQTAILDQVGCVYTPHVLAVQTGQPVEIHNSDDTMHNVRFRGTANPSSNDGTVRGVVLNRTYRNAALGEQFSCDVHPWMGAYLTVFDHPYFFVSDVEGRFEITGLPPGQYTLTTWHENRRIRPVEFQVTVEADTSVRVDVKME